MKRKATAIFREGKKIKGNIVNLSWVSATKTYNYMKKDPLIDWLKMYSSNPPTKPDPFIEYIKHRGNEFEEKIITYIRDNISPVSFVSKEITDESISKTKKLMKDRVPLIYSAPVRNEENNTCGIIDLLVRNDYLPKLGQCPSEKKGDASFYVVVDIKFSTLRLKADGVHILNCNSFPAYKAQLRIYTEAIGLMQNMTPRYAYILGRRYNYISKRIYRESLNPFSKLGAVDYLDDDSDYIIETKKAIAWVRSVREEGKNWTLFPPSKNELYPNMCVDSGEWNSEKKRIAMEIGELTLLWQVGNKHREKALEKKVHSWRDPEVSSSFLNIKGNRGSIIDAILSINRGEHKISIGENLSLPLKENELFLDFETFIDVFPGDDDNIDEERSSYIFMVGIWKDGVYKNFKSISPSEEGERVMLTEFLSYLKTYREKTIYYWSAEKTIWNGACKRHPDLFEESYEGINWIDLCKVFREAPVVIKNCFKFGLKEIAHSLYEHGFIRTNLQTECSSGLIAAINAWKVYKECSSPLLHPILLDIEKYNKFDVEVMADIVSFLRKEIAANINEEECSEIEEKVGEEKIETISAIEKKITPSFGTNACDHQ